MASQAQSELQRDTIRKANDLVQRKLKAEFVPPAIEWEDKLFIVVSRCVNGPQGWVGLCKVAVLDEAAMKKASKVSRREVVNGVYPTEVVPHFEKALRHRLFQQKVKK